MNNSSKNPKEITNKEEIFDRNVAVYFNMASASPPIELHSSVIRDLLKRGNKITVYACDRSFKSPMDNLFNRKSIYRFTKFRIEDAVKNLNIRLKTINLEKQTTEMTDKTSAALEMGVMSSFASLFKVQSRNELSKKSQRAYDNMLGSAKKLYNYFAEEIRKEKYDFVFMFNGRFGDVRPVLEATRDSNIGFGLHEMKRGINEIVFINELVHSIEGNTRRAISFYEKDKEAAEINARKFFKNKVENKSTGDTIFTKDQEKGSLPEAIVNTTKKIIAIYPTTDDEYKFIGKEWEGHVPEDQVNEIEELVTSLSPEDYIVVVKMHPNQFNTAKNTLERYFDLAKKYSHVIVEGPLSKKDTYALMNKADIIVTFASTVGVEACYAGKPVVLIGDTNWGEMNIAHKVYSGGEAGTLIKNGVEPKPILGAIIWGNYMLSYKDELSEFKIVGEGNYLVSGKKIGKSTWRRIWQLPAKLEINMNKPGFKFKTTISKIGSTIINIVRGNWAMN